MVFTSRPLLRAMSALSMSAARWSGRTSASAPFTLPMGVRQASTTNTELTATYLSGKPSASHDRKWPDGRPDPPPPPPLRDRDHYLTSSQQPSGRCERRDRYR